MHQSCTPGLRSPCGVQLPSSDATLPVGIVISMIRVRIRIMKCALSPMSITRSSYAFIY